MTIPRLDTLAIVLGLLAAGRTASAESCEGVEARDCNLNGITDTFDIAPTFALSEPLVLEGSNLPLDVVAVDLDLDGLKDLATANYSGTVSILFGEGLRSFWPAVVLPAAEYAHEIESADFDGDGRIDLAVAGHDIIMKDGFSYDSGWVRVFQNLGKGAFSEHEIIFSSTFFDRPFDLVAKDLDRDGFPDLVAIAGGVMLFWNRGDGTFQDPVEVSTGSQPWSVAPADLDGDGRLDLAISNRGSLDVSVLMNLGSRRFASETRYPIDKGGRRENQNFLFRVTPEDVDGDGDIDLSIGFSVLRNRGDGTLFPAESPFKDDTDTLVLPADVDCANPLELVTMHLDMNYSIFIYHQDGRGVLGRLWFIGDLKVGMTPGLSLVDLDGDGRLDLVVTRPAARDGPDRVEVFWNTTPAATSIDCNSNCIPDECETDCNRNGRLDGCDIESGSSKDCDGNGIPDECEPDCDRDGVPDACEEDCDKNDVPDHCDIPLEPLDHDGNGRIDACEIAEDPGLDCNRNGILDVCDLHVAPGFEAGLKLPLGEKASCMVAADLDGDGLPDLAVGISGTRAPAHRIEILWNGGGSRFEADSTTIALGEEASSLVPGDFDGDGLTDLAAVCRLAIVTIFSHSGPRSFSSSFPIALDGELGEAKPVAADLNADGRLDLIIPTRWDPIVLFNGGNLSFVPMNQGGSGDEPYSLAVADIDGDGDMDLVEGCSYMIRIFLNGGDIEMSSFDVSLGGDDVIWSLAIADLDGDADLDIAASYLGDRIFIAENLGGGSFAPVRLFNPGKVMIDVGALLVGDLDGDGDQDLAVASDGEIEILINNGHGSFWPESLTTGTFPDDLTARDLDGEGTLDLAFLSHGESGSTISIIPNNPAARSLDLDGNGIPDECEAEPIPRRFIRGDANGDGQTDLSDAIVVLFHLFGGEALACRNASDADDSGALDITDPIRILGVLFLGDGGLPRPSVVCGIDPTLDDLGCDRFEPCP